MKFLAALLGCMILGAFGMAQAQTSTMKFARDSWDFGTIPEGGGEVSYTFEFTNSGDKPFVIESVATTCGCTTPKYSREPILAGKKGTIQITYDPNGRPGAFNREVTIYSNGRTNMNVLTIKGDVTPRPRTIEDDYPVTVADGLLASRTSPAMGYVSRGSIKSVTVDLYNNSKKDIDLGIVYDKKSPHFKAVLLTTNLKPGQKAALISTYDLKTENVWGALSDKFFLTVNGVKSSIPFIATGTAIDDFSRMTREQLADAPNGVLQSQYYHFGDIKRGAEKRRDFIITNQGNSPLIIQHVRGNDKITSDLSAGTVIQPGDKKSFTVTLKTEGEPLGKYMQSLVIIMNDPQRPMREIRLAGNII